MLDTDVLIAGAGPTGLVLALWLARSGARVRIVDRAAAPGTTSRALVVHARTLELYRQLGIAGEVVARGVRFDTANLWVRGRQAARVDLGAIGAGATPFPYVIIFPQDAHERLLIERLRECGVDVERPCDLRGFEDRGDRIVAHLAYADGRDERCAAAFLAGCDGAHSVVRDVIAAGFPGGMYAHLFYVADVEARGPVMNRELHVALDEADLLAVFPMQGEGNARLIGTILERNQEARRPLEWSDVSRQVIERLGIGILRVNWFSTYHVHHRVASHFRTGRAFLLGDAAHIHSPVGGQGMNTGVGDAVNLAWKLAAVLASRVDARVLDTYEPERSAFAKRLVATTDRAFQLVTSDGPIARLVRLRVVPRVFPRLFGLPAMRRFMFRTLSQTSIRYRGSALGRGAAGAVRAGDRLPWLDLSTASDTGADNYAPLQALDWQVHVYGEVMSGEGPPRDANCAPTGGQRSGAAASVGAHMSGEGPPRDANCAPTGGQRSGAAASVGAHLRGEGPPRDANSASRGPAQRRKPQAYGDRTGAVVDICRRHAIALHVFPWRDAMRAAGLARNAIYLVRPDGYVGFAGAEDGGDALARYLDEWRITARPCGRPAA